MLLASWATPPAGSISVRIAKGNRCLTSIESEPIRMNVMNLMEPSPRIPSCRCAVDRPSVFFITICATLAHLETGLPPRLVEDHRRGVGQIQAAIALAQRNPQHPLGRQRRKQFSRQSSCFRSQ